MKLEIKHLAPYLPYELKYRDMLYRTDNYLHVLNPLSLSFNRDHIHNIKPILRPLSGLTKEIEVNGEKFVPFDILYDGYKNSPNLNYDYFCLLQIKSIDYKIKKGEISIGMYSSLIEWHFDVFGLIEKGLAIDINNL